MKNLLPLLTLALVFALSSCSTYDKVAVWYKYRNDYHLPKQQDMAKGESKARPASETAQTIAEPADDAQLAQADAVQEDAAPTKLTRAEKKHLRHQLREARTQARMAQRTQTSRQASPAYASTGGPEPGSQDYATWKSRYQVQDDEGSVNYKPETTASNKRMARVMANGAYLFGLIGFIIALIGFLTLGYVFGTIGLILGIIAVVKSDGGLGIGLGIAAIVLGGIVVLYGINHK